MPAGLLLRKLIDGEQIWRMWHGAWQEGKPPMTLAEIYNEFKANNNVNPSTGLPVTRAGLCDSAWRWALKNIDISMPMMKAAYEYEGMVIQDEEIKKMFANRAKHVFSHSRNTYNKFLKSSHLEDYA